MPDPLRLMQFYEFYEYDGTNSADLLDFMQTNVPAGDGPWYIFNEADGLLEFAWDSTTVPQFGYLAVNQGGGLLVAGGVSAQAVGPEWSNFYLPVTSFAPSGVAENPVLGSGITSVPSLNGGASTTVNVPITPELPDTSYTAAAVLIGGTALLASLTVTSTSKISGAQVDVTVQNTGLLPLSGASVLVAAVDQS